MSESRSTTDDLVAKATAACDEGSPLRAEQFCERALSQLRSRELTPGAIAAIDRVAPVLGRARKDRVERAFEAARAVVLTRPSDMPEPLCDGCYLVQPPMIGLQGRRLGHTLSARGIHAVVVTREPMTATGLWPIVAVGERTVRARIEPPAGVVRTGEGITGDRLDELPSIAWFTDAAAAIARAGLDLIDPADPAAWRVEDLLDLLDAHRDAASLCAHLAQVCHEATREPIPEAPRRRPLIDDPYSF